MILVTSLYLFGMLVFMLASFAMFAKKVGVSRLQIANHLWLLGLFCLLHAAYDGLKLYNALSNQLQWFEPWALLWFFRYLTLGAAFFFLALFGIQMYLEMRKSPSLISDKWLRLSKIFLFVLVALISIQAGGQMNEFWLRWCVALPASLLAGIGLVRYSRQLTQRTRQGAYSMRMAGLCMLFFGLVSVLILPHSSAAVASYLVLCLRAFAAGLFVFFILQALSIFDGEQLDLLEHRLARFAQSERLSSLGRLAAGVAHEINNPLANAALNMDMLAEELHEPDLAKNRIERVNRSLDRASNIARELLQVSRDAESDEARPVKLQKLVDSAVNLVAAQATENEILLSGHTDACVDCIGWKLEEVLINLLQNAIDASPRLCPIDVRLRQKGGELTVTVSDKGSGVAQIDRERIFEPFFTTKEPGKGTGLGLAVCHAIVEAHRGTLTYEDRVGGGAEFTLTLAESRYV